MKIAYIAGKYRAETVSEIVYNIRKAEFYAKKYWEGGYAVICPHMNSALLDGVVPDKAFLKGDKEIIKRLTPHHDVMVMIPGWQQSSGAVGEHALAKKIGLNIICEQSLT